MNKIDKRCCACYIVASLSFYIAAIINFSNENSGNATVDLCLGSTFLCLATTYANKDKDNKKSNK